MNAFFDSTWIPGPSEMVRAVRSPYSREVIDTVPVCDEQTVDQALRRLAEERTCLDQFTGERLGTILGNTAASIRSHLTELADLITREQGKPLAESRDEVAVAAELLDSFARDGYRLGRRLQPLAAEARVGDRFGFTRTRPIGIEAILCPNTFPFLLPAKLIAPALSAGNLVVIKPASATPLSALKLVELLLEGGLPPAAIACLTGPGTQTGRAICSHPLVDQVVCYGGMETIRAVRSSIGLIPLQFHHGGMTVCVIARDADLDLAVRCIVAQGFENAGQTAISVGAVYAAAPVYEEFTERLAVAMKDLKVGDPFAPGTRVGPLTEQDRAIRASRIVGDLLGTGARVVTGTGQNDGNLFAPTLVSDVPPDHPSVFPVNMSRELRSPLLCVSRIDGDLGRIASWLDRRSQPAVSLFSRDLEAASELARTLPVFNVHVNGIPTWRDGVIFTSQATGRLGRQRSEAGVLEVSTNQDIVFHPV